MVGYYFVIREMINKGCEHRSDEEEEGVGGHKGDTTMRAGGSGILGCKHGRKETMIVAQVQDKVFPHAS